MGKIENTTSIKALHGSAIDSIVGDVFYSRISSVLDTIRFYQVTRMITQNKAIVRELHQLNTYGEHCNFSSPIIGRFISEEIEVCFNQHEISKESTVLGSRLAHSILSITHDVSVKIWDSVQH